MDLELAPEHASLRAAVRELAQGSVLPHAAEVDRDHRFPDASVDAVKEAGLPWTSFGRYEMRAKGPGVIVPMDMLRDITASGVVGDATKARRELGDRMVEALITRIVQVCKETAGKE